jgi:hypothetical protein
MASIAEYANNTIDDYGSPNYRCAGTSTVGSNNPHNNISSCISAYLWERIS